MNMLRCMNFIEKQYVKIEKASRSSVMSLRDAFEASFA